VRQWLVRPQKPVTERAERLHGITNNSLVSAPRFAEIAEDVRAQLAGAILVGHNVGVDVQLLQPRLAGWQPIATLDTLRLAKHLRPGASSYALGALAEAFGLDGIAHARHRAADDAQLTAKLFLTLVANLDPDGRLNVHTLAELGASADDHFFKSQQQGLF
jgi:DNA polymerase III epsilon subunit family exonuclease